MAVPMTIIQNERQQSAVNTAIRISVRFFTNGFNCSAGIWLKACASLLLIKSLKNIFGASANSSAIPAVSANDVYSQGACDFNSCGSSTIFFKASIASNGIVNSAITNIDDTVLNFAYIGI